MPPHYVFMVVINKMNVSVGDKLEMKKPHPCGNNVFDVLRVGIDFRIHCCKCGRDVLVPRSKIERNIKRIISSLAEE